MAMEDAVSQARQFPRDAETKPLTASDWLENEHRVLEENFDRITDGRADLAAGHAAELMRELSIYLTVEETVLLPRLQQPDCLELARIYVEENLDDHQVIRHYLEELSDLRQIPYETLLDTVSRLRAAVNHVVSEEESGLIHLTEYCLDEGAQIDAGIEMQRKQRELLEQGG